MLKFYWTLPRCSFALSAWSRREPTTPWHQTSTDNDTSRTTGLCRRRRRRRRSVCLCRRAAAKWTAGCSISTTLSRPSPSLSPTKPTLTTTICCWLLSLRATVNRHCSQPLNSARLCTCWPLSVYCSSAMRRNACSARWPNFKSLSCSTRSSTVWSGTADARTTQLLRQTRGSSHHSKRRGRMFASRSQSRFSSCDSCTACVIIPSMR